MIASKIKTFAKILSVKVLMKNLMKNAWREVSHNASTT